MRTSAGVDVWRRSAELQLGAVWCLLACFAQSWSSALPRCGLPTRRNNRVGFCGRLRHKPCTHPKGNYEHTTPLLFQLVYLPGAIHCSRPGALNQPPRLHAAAQFTWRCIASIAPSITSGSNRQLFVYSSRCAAAQRWTLRARKPFATRKSCRINPRPRSRHGLPPGHDSRGSAHVHKPTGRAGWRLHHSDAVVKGP